MIAQIVVFFITVHQSASLLPGFYCGNENCYDVLGVTRESARNEIAKAYRKLAAKYHPDRNRGSPEETKKAEERFRVVATAYETLRDDDGRRDYDYMLDNPDEIYRHYYYYYRHRVAPKVDVRLVILATIAIVSIIQYISAWHNYNSAISYLHSVPKYRIKATEIAKERGLLNKEKKKGKLSRSDKESLKEEEESIIKSIIQENIDLRGGYRKPSSFDLLIVQILIFPYTLFMYVKWYVRWVWKFRIHREEYGNEEKLHIIRKKMKLSKSQFDCLEQNELDEYLSDELWIDENFQRWQAEKDDRERKTLAESAQHKRYRRYMKNQGPGQITFLDDD